MLKRDLMGTFIATVAVMTSFAVAGPVTDPKDPKLPVDFKIQGEYEGKAGSAKIGIQIIALDKGEFHAVVYPGGLPGAGWDGKNKSLMAGKLDGAKAVFAPATGKLKYMDGGVKTFSATKKNPPVGNVACSAMTDGVTMSGKVGGKAFSAKRVERVSDTMGAKPPAGALVLFDGTNKDHWNGGRLDEKTKFLNTDGKDIRTKKKFSNYTMHIEFMLPYKPDGRSQGRGNSGFYQIDMYEMQILDSFGLEGLDNECGGIYKRANSLVNMCFPPLQWQTYDVVFTNAVVEGGKKTKNAMFTAKLNGVLIHDNLSIKGKTGGSRRDAEGTPGVHKLQGHGNPVQFRNIWIVEKK
jgi:hypothetical protein